MGVDQVTYGSLIHAFAKVRVRVCLRAFPETQTQTHKRPSPLIDSPPHLPPSPPVPSPTQVGQWEAALRFLSEMRSHPGGVRPNNFVYCSAMSACNRGNEWAVALDLLKQVRVFWGDRLIGNRLCLFVCLFVFVGGV